MPTDSLAPLVDALRRNHLLTAPQLDDLTRDLVGRFPEPRALAAELIRRGWLTPYQVNQLLQGRGDGLLLGSYVLLERIGEGGMGQVFRACNWKLNTVVALKLIRKDRLDNADAVRRFHREIRAAAQLDHPNIVRALDADEVNGAHLLVMDFVPGVDLAKLVKGNGPLPIDKACDYARQAALGLQQAHKCGLVHRDIKPHNLLLTPQGVVKILDMGLARLHYADDNEASGTMTREGTVMGSLDFIAPEQALNSHAVDVRADLYSLGCTLYYLLAGRVPFPGGSAMEKLVKHQWQEPEPVERVRPGVPAAVAAVVRKLMAKRREERYQTPAEAAAALAACVVPAVPAVRAAATTDSRTLDFRSGNGVIVAPPTRRAGRRGLLYAAAGLGGLLLAALIALLAWRGRPLPAAPPEGGTGIKVVWAPGPPQGMLPGLIARPARLPGIRRWQVETQWPRCGISCVSWSPDGKLIAYGDKGGRIWLIDGETRRLVQLLPGHEGGVTCVAWSPDGAWLASGGGWADKVVRLWRPDGTRGPVLTGHMAAVDCVAWSPDGKRLASGGHWGDSTVRIWSVDGAAGPVLPHDTLVNCVAWSPDGHVLATTDSGKQLIRLWNTADGTPLTTLGPLPRMVNALAWSPDGKYLASNGGDFAKDHVAGWIWDVAEKKQAASLGSTGIWTNWLGWSVEGGLAYVTQDGYVVLYDPRSGKVVKCTAQYRPMQSASWSPDGRRIADDTGRILAVSKGGREITPTGFQPHYEKLNGVAWNSDGKLLPSSSDGGVIRLWATDGSPGTLLKMNAGWINTVAWCPDRTRLAAAGNEGTVRLWNADGSAGSVLRGHESDVYAVAWSPDGKRLASTGGDKTVRLWDADGTRGPVLRDNKEVMFAVAWSSDGKRLAAAGDGGTIQLWDADGTPGPALGGHQNCWVTGLAWDPRGERLASAYSDGTVRLWNKDGSPGPVLTGHEGQVWAVTWSPDGKRLASANEHGTVRLWDADGTPGQELRGHEGEVRSVAWSADGERLASAGRDSTLRVWDANGEAVWMAVLLPDGNAAVFSAAGELLHGDPDSVEQGLVYLVEQDDGHIAYLLPSEFRERLGAAVKGGGR